MTRPINKLKWSKGTIGHKGNSPLAEQRMFKFNKLSATDRRFNCSTRCIKSRIHSTASSSLRPQRAQPKAWHPADSFQAQRSEHIVFGLPKALELLQSTSSSHDGLFISTGVIAADAVATSAESNFHSFRQFLSPFDNAGGDSIEFVPRQLSLPPQNTFFDTEQRQKQQQQQHMTRGSGNNPMEQINAADQGDDGKMPVYAFCLNQRQNGEEGFNNDGISMGKRWPTKSRMEPLEPINGQMQLSGCEATKIKLNLFGNDDEDASINDDKCTELVPLVRSYSKAPTPSFLLNRDAQKCQKMSSDPLLCDTTTTTTTVSCQTGQFALFPTPERPPKGRIIKEFTDRKLNFRTGPIRFDMIRAYKKASNGDCPINSSPVSIVPFAGLSPPQRSSTPLRFITDPVSVQQPTDATQQIERTIAASSSDGDLLLQSTEDMTTVLRRQRRDKSERFLRQRKMDSAKREQKEEAESSDFVNPKGNGLVRSSASDNIFKLYQTKDCLGRVVCEW
uniref:Protein Wnt n=1 Tax=Globodera pallida TaxID=36090 RepID=A0A183CGD3_GLOPA